MDNETPQGYLPEAHFRHKSTFSRIDSNYLRLRGYSSGSHWTRRTGLDDKNTRAPLATHGHHSKHTDTTCKNTDTTRKIRTPGKEWRAGSGTPIHAHKHEQSWIQGAGYSKLTPLLDWAPPQHPEHEITSWKQIILLTHNYDTARGLKSRVLQAHLLTPLSTSTPPGAQNEAQEAIHPPDQEWAAS